MHPTAPLQKAIRRLALTTKQGPHNYYKGNRTGAMGRHTKYGGYIVEPHKVRTYECPDLRDFKLTPFVSKRLDTDRKDSPFKPSRPKKKKIVDLSDGAAKLKPAQYLEKWKAQDERDKQ